MSETIPDHAQILVIGGGPAGSYASTLLAREGFDVVLFEADHFPRYHIGESMLPSCRYFFRYIDLDDTIKNHGFVKKPGATFKLAGEKREAYSDFIAHGDDNAAWNVVRSEFDEILLRHAQKTGARVFEGVRVTSLHFQNEGIERPTAAEYRVSGGSGAGGGDKEETKVIKFDYLIDASGRGSVLATKYLKNRHYNSSLKNVASWGYWKGTNQYGIGTRRHNAPWFEANSEESGWNWSIPLHNGYTSVGVVMNQDASNARKQKAKEANGGVSLTSKEHYLSCLKLTPVLISLIGEGTLVEGEAEGNYGKIHQASDYSYSAPTYSGDHYRLIGDAAAFIDPFFSSGVHIAFTGALSAAATIASSIRGEIAEAECQKYHNEKVGVAYTRFMVIVLSAYKQMRAQKSSVMSDFNTNDFDRAFDLIRPVIQGHVDVGKRFTEDEIEKTLTFVGGIFEPVDPELAASVAERIDGKLFDMSAPIMTPDKVDKVVGESDVEARQVLKELNARKMTGDSYGSIESWSDEVASGYVARTKIGKLGLVKVGQ